MSLPKRNIKPFWIKLRWVITLSCLFTILVTTSTAPEWNPFHENPSSAPPALCAGAIIVLALYWTMITVHYIFQVVYEPIIDQALVRIPGPDEIELELRRNGWDPSIQDIAAVHQMLTAQRNEAVGTLAATAAVMYAIRKA